MKNIIDFIVEKLIINKHSKAKSQYTCKPNDWKELREIIEERLKHNKNANLNDIDISNIISMYNIKYNIGLFEKLDPHNIDISQWDVSNVEDMGYMFYNCKNFNCDLSDWDVSNVEDMTNMFAFCRNFKGEGLENWKIDNLKNKDSMFYECDSLTKKPSWSRKIL